MARSRNSIFINILSLLFFFYACSPVIQSKNHSTNNDAEGRIFIQGENGLFSINPDGSDMTYFEKGLLHFKISPDSKWLLVIESNPTPGHVRIKSLKLISLHSGLCFPFSFPEGDWAWGESWWSDDSCRLNVYVEAGWDGKGRWIEKFAEFNVNTGELIIKDFKDTRIDLFEFVKRVYPRKVADYEVASPDRKFILKWLPIQSEYDGRQLKTIPPSSLGFNLFILNIDSTENRSVFKRDPDFKFRTQIRITQNAWAPDSQSFVISQFDYSFWKDVWRSLAPNPEIEDTNWKVFVVDRNTLKWKFIAYGRDPVWLDKLPEKLVEKPAIKIHTRIELW